MSLPLAENTAGNPLTLRARLAELGDERALIAFLKTERAALLESAAHIRLDGTAAGGRFWMHRHADLLDAVLRRLLALACERTGQATKNGIAVIATGGYGQHTLAPHSDLDLTFLLVRDDDSPTLRALFGLVMDVLMNGARLSVGYGYRTVSDVETLDAVEMLGADAGASGLGGETLGTDGALPYDHQTQTALLDARLIAGDSALFARFDRGFARHLQIAPFLFRKHAEWMRRGEKFGTSPLVAEPQLKEGAGGLRDIQTAAWMARIRYNRHSGTAPGGELWRELARRKVITDAECAALVADRDFLLSVRCLLHATTTERKDTLTRPRQEQVARMAGLDLEAFLHRCYATLLRIRHTTEKVIARALESPVPLPTPGLASARRTVVIAEPERLSDPLWPMRALSYCQTYNLSVAPATEEAIERVCDAGATWAADTGAALLPELLSRPGDIGASVRRLHRTGLLRLLLPELWECMTLPAYDAAHLYTVGEHSIRVLENLAGLRPPGTAAVGYIAPAAVPAPSTEQAALRELLESLPTPVPLLLAALLHDVGKRRGTLNDGTPAPHERTGAEMAVGICARLGLSDSVSADVILLVREHLLMAETARLRDLHLPETIRLFAGRVGTAERLKMLYLLTWADTSAVAPGVWTPLQAGQVAELFGRAFDHFAGQSRAESEVSGEDADARTREVRARVRRQLAREAELALPLNERGKGAGERTEAARAYSEAMPAAYLLATPLPVMAQHLLMMTRLRGAADPSRPVVDLRTAAPDADHTDLIVVAYDDPAPGLLAKITGVLLAFDVRVHTVQAFTRAEEGGEGRIVLDTLSIDYHGRPLSPIKRADVAEAMTQVLAGEVPLADLLARRDRESAASAPLRAPVRVLLADDAVGQGLTLLDIAAPDEIGIAHRLCALFSALGTDIRSARVSSWGGSARCAFYVSGGRLPVAGLRAAVEAAFGGA